MHFLYSVYYELTAFTCFKYYLLIFRRHCISNIWYISCVLCRLSVADIINARSVPVVYAAPPEDEQVVLETCRGC
jgi:hypothetical protein